MKPTEELVAEHQAVMVALDILDRMAGLARTEGQVSIDHAEALTEFLQVFVDACHHGKEETLLFEALERAGVPREGGLVGVLLIEHQVGRVYVQTMVSAVERFMAGEEGALARFADAATQYTALLRNHIVKEDRDLYPLADAKLDAEEQEHLEEGFERIEREVVGEGRHEAFHKMLETLRAAYLET
ncbi:MAG: hemerythrin domain-containing protein [Anaerolineae bacterium]